MHNELCALNKTIGWILACSTRIVDSETPEDAQQDMATLLMQYNELYTANEKIYLAYSLLEQGYEIVGGEPINAHLNHVDILKQLGRMRGKRIPATMRRSLLAPPIPANT